MIVNAVINEDTYELDGGTSIKLGTIDHHPVVSIIKGVCDVIMTSRSKNFF